MIRWLFLLIGFSLFAQKEYVFNQVLEYDVLNSKESAHSDVETRLYFVNTQDVSYQAVAIKKDNGKYLFVFRDDKRDKISELEVSEEVVFDLPVIRVDKANYVKNTYRCPDRKSNYAIERDSSSPQKEKVIYTFNKKSNPFQIKAHTIILDKTYTGTRSNVGFGDYYAPLDWGKQFPAGRIVESFTEREDGSIVNHFKLNKAFPVKKRIRFE